MLFALSNSFVYSQNEQNIWYFGKKAGLDFNSGTATALTNSKLDTEEGCAARCDADGKLLFYTDGNKIWNRNHQLMPNGTGLLGHSSSTQSAVIVPMPGSRDQYYVFTVSDRSRNDGFRYSIVDMSLDDGNGDVTDKNIFLFESTTEKVAALNHANCFDKWVIAHEWGNNRFRAYLITQDSIFASNPVPSDVGLGHLVRNNDDRNKRGYMKASADGTKIGLALSHDAIYQVFDFNNETGEVSNPVTIKVEGKRNAYGLEFSPDGSKLYVNFSEVTSDMEFFVSKDVFLYQFDLEAGDEADILKSGVTIHDKTYDDTFSPWDDDAEYMRDYNIMGAMQAGPDGKIYIARYYSDYLASIANPNEKGTACGFQLNAVKLGGKRSMWGLPVFCQGNAYESSVVFCPDTLAEIGSTFAIPVYARLNDGSCGSLDLALNAEIRMNAFFFEPTGISSGDFTKTFDGDELVVNITADTIDLGTDTTLICELYGKVLLADTNHTDIILSNVSWLNNSYVEAEVFDGSLRIYGSCLPEGRGLKFLESAAITASPNPASDFINIESVNGYNHNMELNLYNINGCPVFENDRQISGKYGLDVSGIPAGYYRLMIKSGAGIINKQIMIIH